MALPFWEGLQALPIFLVKFITARELTPLQAVFNIILLTITLSQHPLNSSNLSAAILVGLSFSLSIVEKN